MQKLKIGDVTKPEETGRKVIVHCCNDLGLARSGVIVAIENRWPKSIEEYRKLDQYRLGDIQVVQVEDDTFVCNLIGQQGVGGEYINNVFVPPVRYEALRIGLLRLRQWCSDNNVDQVILPYKMCADRAGGDWDTVVTIIDGILHDLQVTIYKFQE